MAVNRDIPIETLFKCLMRDYKNLKVELGKEKSYNEELETYIGELEAKLKSVPSVPDDLTAALEKNKQLSAELEKVKINLQTQKKHKRTIEMLLKGACTLRNDALSKVAFYEKKYGKQI